MDVPAFSPAFLREFEILSLLGQGGMGAVYLARDTFLGREVALKVLKAVSEPDRARFAREARVLAALTHPRILTIHRAGMDGDIPYLISELVRGDTLQELLARRCLPLDEGLLIVDRIAEALVHAHGQGVVHRDVKPANVFVTAALDVKLADFGLAYQEADAHRLTAQGAVMGTPHYMAPEQVRGQSAGPAADQYALGCLLYELACGRLPFVGASPLAVMFLRVQTVPAPPGAHRPGLPGGLDALCMRMLRADPAERFPSIAEVRAELAKVSPVVSSGRLVRPAHVRGSVEEGADTPTAVPGADRITDAVIPDTPTAVPGADRITDAVIPGPNRVPHAPVIAACVVGGFVLLAAAFALRPGVEPAPGPSPTAVASPASPVPARRTAAGMVNEAGAPMVLVPAGVYRKGRGDDAADPQHDPEHDVEVSAFWMDACEVTNARFGAFVQATAYRTELERGEGKAYGADGTLLAARSWREPRGAGVALPGFERLPVVLVTAGDARAFSRWAGLDLPTDAEWEKAARGGAAGKLYPWGNLPPDASRACSGHADLERGPDPVGTRNANRLGLFDMSGNVAEWCRTVYAVDAYAEAAVMRAPGQVDRDPRGPAEGNWRVVRGGSWHDGPAALECARTAGSHGQSGHTTVGFRCVARGR